MGMSSTIRRKKLVFGLLLYARREGSIHTKTFSKVWISIEKQVNVLLPHDHFLDRFFRPHKDDTNMKPITEAINRTSVYVISLDKSFFSLSTQSALLRCPGGCVLGRLHAEKRPF